MIIGGYPQFSIQQGAYVTSISHYQYTNQDWGVLAILLMIIDTFSLIYWKYSSSTI